jgi:hypothetical protein
VLLWAKFWVRFQKIVLKELKTTRKVVGIMRIEGPDPRLFAKKSSLSVPHFCGKHRQQIG